MSALSSNVTVYYLLVITAVEADIRPRSYRAQVVTRTGTIASTFKFVLGGYIANREGICAPDEVRRRACDLTVQVNGEIDAR